MSTLVAQSAPGMGARRCALVVGLDGFRPDCITAEHAPTLHAIIHPQQAAATAAAAAPSGSPPPLPVIPSAYSLRSQVGDICWSGPGWTSACTGVWRNSHGVSGNLFATQQFDEYPTLFQRLKTARPDAVTACAVNWAPLGEHVLRPADHSVTHEDDDAAVLAAAQQLLRDLPRLDLLFVHLDLVDAAGHEFDYGPAVPEYVAAVRETDARLAALLRTLHTERRWTATEDWMTLITTDHGGIDFTHEVTAAPGQHWGDTDAAGADRAALDGSRRGSAAALRCAALHATAASLTCACGCFAPLCARVCVFQDGRPENRTNFIVVQNGDAAAGEIFPAPLIVDVAPTVLAHLGVKLQSGWRLDGRPVGLKLTDAASGRAQSFMDLDASQDPLGRFPILPEELEAGPSPDVPIDVVAAEAAKLHIAERLPSS